jgi:hypothetical protein
MTIKSASKASEEAPEAHANASEVRSGRSSKNAKILEDNSIPITESLLRLKSFVLEENISNLKVSGVPITKSFYG